MSRRRPPPKKSQPRTGSSIHSKSEPTATVASPSQSGSGRSVPTLAVRWALSFWVLFHLVALTISYTGVVEPSALHAQLMAVVHPYVRPTHFAADDRPVYLTHGESDEQPHRIQVTKRLVSEMESAGEKQWVTVGPGEEGGLAATPGLAVSDRVARWLATAAMLAENDQPSMVADLLLPVVQSDSEIHGIRIIRYPTDLSDVNAEQESVYVARVIRKDGAVSLVQLKERRLSSVPIGGAAVGPSRSTTATSPGSNGNGDRVTGGTP